MSRPLAMVHAMAATAIGYVCAIEKHVSPTLAKTTYCVLSGLLSLIFPA